MNLRLRESSIARQDWRPYRAAIFHRTPCVRPDAPFDPASPRRQMRPDHIAVPEPCEHDSCFVRLWQGRVYQPDRPIAAHPRRNSVRAFVGPFRSEEHTSELQSLMHISYAVFCLKKKKTI